MQRKPHPRLDNLATCLAHLLLRVSSTLSNGMPIPQSNTGYEPNSELDMAGRVVPTVELTPTSRCSFQRVQMLHSNYAALVTFSQAENDFIPSFLPIPSQTRVNPWQLQYPSTYPQCSPAVLGPQETVQLVTQRAPVWRNEHSTGKRRL